MKRIIALMLLVGCLGGCSAALNHFEKGAKGLSSGNYKVTVYSGGQLIRTYEVKDGFINTEVNSDGYYWIQGDKLVRVSGTVIVEQE